MGWAKPWGTTKVAPAWEFDDGGRMAAGFRGETRDCVVRAIAISAQLPYRQVYDQLAARAAQAKRKAHRTSPRLGVHKAVYQPFLADLGFRWVPTMTVGGGCTHHVDPVKLPSGRLILRLSRHLTAMVDGVVRDTYDPSRGGQRCVYGYWLAPR